jgi:peptide/nickel transport system permease protein
MTRYVLRRLLLLVVTMLVTSFIIFGLTQLLPGDVAKLVLGRDASPTAIANFNAQFGLDEPALQQYVNWLVGFVTGDWGKSFTAGSPPVRPLVLDRLINSLILTGFTLAVAVPISILLGIIAALNQNKWIDNIISVVSLLLVGLPEFVTGIVLVNILAINFGWFEATSLLSDNMTLVDWLRILMLPALTASFVLVGYVARMTRAGMLEELRKSYVRTAILKGLSQRTVIIRHVLRNAVLPTLTVIAVSIGWLMGGLVVIENVFNYPGMGSLLVTAVTQKNLPVLQAVSVMIVFVFAFANLVSDILYALLNPRIRLD